MKIQNQVCTYEQGNKLRDLGITADSYFTWINCAKRLESGSTEWHPCLFQPQLHGDPFCIAYPLGDTFDDYGVDGEFHETGKNSPAFTSAELGTLLYLFCSRVEVQNNGRYLILENGLGGVAFNDTSTEAEGRAEFLIWLLQKVYILPFDCNSRLEKA